LAHWWFVRLNLGSWSARADICHLLNSTDNAAMRLQICCGLLCLVLATAAGKREKSVSNKGLIRSSNLSVRRPPNAAERDLLRDGPGKCTRSNEKPHILPNTPMGPPCPGHCPFAQPLPGDPCAKVCITSDLCSEFHPARGFADAKTQECVPTCGIALEDRIPGCAECAGQGVCSKCIGSLYGSFRLSADGKHCTSPMYYFWVVVRISVALLFFLICYYLVCLQRFRRSGVADTQGAKAAPIEEGSKAIATTEHAVFPNSRNLVFALRHRMLCYPLHVKIENDGNPSWHSYALWKTNVHSVDVSGLGAALYFNWLVFCGACALALFSGSEIALIQSRRLYDIQSKLKGLKCYMQDYSSEHIELIEDNLQFESQMFTCLGITYLLIVAASLVFSGVQLQIVKRFNKGHNAQAAFAVSIKNLPPDATDASALSKEFQAKLDALGADLPQQANVRESGKVIGVSICYDLKGAMGERGKTKQEEMQGAIDEWIQELDATRRRRLSVLEDLPVLTAGDSADDLASGVSFKARASISLMAGFSPQVTPQLRGTAPPDDASVSPTGDGQEELRPFFKLHFVDNWLADFNDPVSKEQCEGFASKLLGSGSAVVILSSGATRNRLYEAVVRDPKVAGVIVEASLPINEPVSTQWHNFGQSRHFWWNIVVAIIMILLFVAVWAAMYLPYALEYITYSRIPGEKPGLMSDLALGVLIGLGNVLLGNVIEYQLDKAGFQIWGRRNITVLSLAFLANLLNVCADLWVTLHIAKGAQLDAAFSGDVSGYDRVVVRELMSLIVPGYLFTPYIIEPLFSNFVPYWLNRWLVRSDKRWSRRDAEKVLEAPNFEFCWRYADMLCNFTICTMLLLFVNQSSAWLMIWLFAFIAFLYCQDKLRLLKHCSQTFDTTHWESSAFAHWWVVPTSCLAGVVAWWGYKSHIFESLGIPTNFGMHVLWALPLLHFVVYLSLLRLLHYFCEPPASGNELDYADAIKMATKEGKLWNHFNCNPGHCLKSRFSKTGRTTTIPWIRGKGYLQAGAPDRLAEDVVDGMVSASWGSEPLSKKLQKGMISMGFSGGSKREGGRLSSTRASVPPSGTPGIPYSSRRGSAVDERHDEQCSKLG